MGVGQPTKYKPEYCKKLVEHLASGLSFDCFVPDEDNPVCLETLYTWTRKHDEFLEAKKLGTFLCRKFWEQVGRQGAIGKMKGFNAASWVFNMKNRFNWTDRQSVEHSGEVGLKTVVNITLPDNGRKNIDE